MTHYNLDQMAGTRFQKLGSTIVPLLATEAYTSAMFYSAQHLYLVGCCLADQDGNLAIEFSYDNVPNIIGQTATEYFANDPLNFKVPLTAPYFRVQFTNGLVAQTSFRLEYAACYE